MPISFRLNSGEQTDQDDVVSTVDVLTLTEIIETEGEMDFKRPALLTEMKISVKDQYLFLFDGGETYKLPLKKALGIRKINQGIPLVEEWNKSVPPSSKSFQKDGILLRGKECIGLRFFYALEVLYFGETYRLLFPAYELNKFRNMTSGAILSPKNSFHSGKIKPEYYWNIPEGAILFFSHQSDVVFKTRHPVAYKILCAIGMMVSLLPMALFFFFEALLFPPEKQGPLTGYGATVGCIGALFVGIGLFNLVAAWVRQYLGHWVTLFCFLIGGILLFFSFWMQLF